MNSDFTCSFNMYLEALCAKPWALDEGIIQCVLGGGLPEEETVYLPIYLFIHSFIY